MLIGVIIAGMVGVLAATTLVSAATRPTDGRVVGTIEGYLPVIMGVKQNGLSSPATSTAAASATTTSLPAFTATPSNTPTTTWTATATATPAASFTPGASWTPTNTPTATPTATATPAVSNTPTPTAEPPPLNWWNSQWAYRVPVDVAAAGVMRTDKYVDIPIDFSALFARLGISGALDVASLRVIEVDNRNEILDTAVPFQFDPAPEFDAASDAVGTITLFLAGETGASGRRLFHIYFDQQGGQPFLPAEIPARIAVNDGVMDEGQESFQILTGTATYFYHKEGGGFSSLLDTDGLDWISYNPAPGSAGDFRGIPNMSPYFHPGRSGVVSTLRNTGPLKVTIHSVVLDEKQKPIWELLWAIYPDQAVMTLLKAAGNYWFLYEGTPGGLLQTSSDFIVRSNGTKTKASVKWANPIVNGEWLYFSDPDLNRSLFMAHHQEDEQVDSYWAMNGEMTVFGFGRKDLLAHMNQVPATFTLGLAEQTAYEVMQGIVNAAYRDLVITVGEPEKGK